MPASASIPPFTLFHSQSSPHPKPHWWSPVQPVSIPGLGLSSCSELTIWSPCSQTKLVNLNELIWKYLKIMKCLLKCKFLAPFGKSQVVATLYPHYYELSNGCPLQIKDMLSSSPQSPPFPIVSHHTSSTFSLCTWSLWEFGFATSARYPFLSPYSPWGLDPTTCEHISSGPSAFRHRVKQLYPYHITTWSPVPGHLSHPQESGFHRSWCDSCPY